MEILYFSFQKSDKNSSTSFRMNFVNFMNLPRPLYICLVKKIKKGLFFIKNGFIERNITKQMGTPIPKFTKFIGFTRHFWPFFKKIMGKVVENTRFLLNSNELCEYLCICSGSKGVFCHDIRFDRASQKNIAKSSTLFRMNFVKPGIFEVHRMKRPGKGLGTGYGGRKNV